MKLILAIMFIVFTSCSSIQRTTIVNVNPQDTVQYQQDNDLRAKRWKTTAEILFIILVAVVIASRI